MVVVLMMLSAPVILETERSSPAGSHRHGVVSLTTISGSYSIVISLLAVQTKGDKITITLKVPPSVIVKEGFDSPGIGVRERSLYHS